MGAVENIYFFLCYIISKKAISDYVLIKKDLHFVPS